MVSLGIEFLNKQDSKLIFKEKYPVHSSGTINRAEEKQVRCFKNICTYFVLLIAENKILSMKILPLLLGISHISRFFWFLLEGNECYLK